MIGLPKLKTYGKYGGVAHSATLAKGNNGKYVLGRTKKQDWRTRYVIFQRGKVVSFDTALTQYCF